MRTRFPGSTVFRAGMTLVTAIALFTALPPAGATEAELVAARNAWQRGDSVQAISLLKAQLVDFPDSPAPRLLLARIELDLRWGEAAENTLRRAEVAGASGAEFVALLARALLLQHKFEELFTLTDHVAWGALADRAEIAALRGDANVAIGDLTAARGAYEQAAEIMPGQVRAELGLVRLDLIDRRLDAARTRVEAVTQANPNSATAWMLLAEVQTGQGAWRGAELSLTKAVIAASDKALSTFKRALVRIELGDLDGAARDIDAVAATNPDFSGLLLARGAMALRAGDATSAEPQLEHYLALNPDDHQAQYMLALALAELGHTELAISSLRRYLELRPGSLLAQLALSRLLLDQGDRAATEAMLRPLANSGIQNPSLYRLIGDLRIVQSRRDRAQDWLSASVRLAPDNVANRVVLAENLIALNRIEQAQDQLDLALRLDPGSQQAQQLRLELLVLQRRWRQAIKACDALAAAMPDDQRRRIMLALIYLADGDTAQALAVLTPDQEPQGANAVGLHGLLSAQAGEPAARYLLAYVYATQGELGFMEDALIAALRSDPDHRLRRPAVDAALAQLEDDSLRDGLLQRLIVEGKWSPRLVERRAALLMETGAIAEAEALLRDGRRYDPDDAGLVRQLAGLLYASGDETGAIKMLEHFLRGGQDDPMNRFLLAQLYAAQGEPQQALTLFEGLLTAGPGWPRNAVVLNNLAWLLREQQPTRALSYAEQALQLQPDDAEVMDTLGGLLVRGGEVDRGLGLLAKAAAARPGEPGIAYRYADALHRAGRDAEALSVLRPLVDKSFPNRPAAEQLLERLGG